MQLSAVPTDPGTVRQPQKFGLSTSSGSTRIRRSQELEDLDVGDVEVGPLVQVLVGVVPG